MTIHRRVGLGHDKVLLLICREEIILLLHATIFYFAIRGFDKAEFVNFTERRKTRDQSDVRTFRSFDRTDPPVMGRMHVTNFEARTLPA